MALLEVHLRGGETIDQTGVSMNYDMNFAYFCYPNLLSIDVTCRIKWYCWSHFSKWFQLKDFLVWYWLLWKFILCGKLFDCWFPSVQLTPVEFGFQEKIEIDRSFKVKHGNHEESPIKLMEGEMSQRGFIRVRFRKKEKNNETVQLLVVDNIKLFLLWFGIASLSDFLFKN